MLLSPAAKGVRQTDPLSAARQGVREFSVRSGVVSVASERG